jgi:hypothetical protein
MVNPSPKLKDAVKDFVAKLNSGPMDRNDVWKLLQEWIGAALSYPLTATQLTYDEWEKEIMSPLLQAVLPQSRVLQEHAKGSSFWTI